MKHFSKFFYRIFSGFFALLALMNSSSVFAGEADLILPDLKSVNFLGGIDGHTLLATGLLVCAFGFGFGILKYIQIRDLPVHKSMKDVSELIYETCKTYLFTQGKFLVILELFIGVIIVVYFGLLRHLDAGKVIVILISSIVGICGSYGVAWFGIRINTFANSRTSFAGLMGKNLILFTLSQFKLE